MIVEGVSGTAGGSGYFGFSYYEQAQDKLNLVGVAEKAGGACVKPSTATIQDGSYKPLSRPLFMYPSEKALARPEVKAFMDFVIANQEDIAKASQIVPMTPEQATKGEADLKAAERRPPADGSLCRGIAGRNVRTGRCAPAPRRGADPRAAVLGRGALCPHHGGDRHLAGRAGVHVLQGRRASSTSSPGGTWDPRISGQYGVWPLINGTLLITGIALLVAVPLGLGTAIYLAEYARPRVRRVVKPVIELLAGIPTIVFGYFALTYFTPTILQDLLHIKLDLFNALSAGIVMGFMVLPTVASVAEDAMSSVPQSLREGAFGLGASKLQVSLRVVFPAALSGIVAAIVLGISRAIGETMIVLVAAGLQPNTGIKPTRGLRDDDDLHRRHGARRHPDRAAPSTSRCSRSGSRCSLSR